MKYIPLIFALSFVFAIGSSFPSSKTMASDIPSINCVARIGSGMPPNVKFKSVRYRTQGQNLTVGGVGGQIKLEAAKNMSSSVWGGTRRRDTCWQGQKNGKSYGFCARKQHGTFAYFVAHPTAGKDRKGNNRIQTQIARCR